MGKKGGRTFDGYKLADIIKLAENLGAKVREGNKHKAVVTYPGSMPCALGPTTGFKRHVLPWIHHNFPTYSNQQIYRQMDAYV